MNIITSRTTVALNTTTITTTTTTTSTTTTTDSAASTATTSNDDDGYDDDDDDDMHIGLTVFNPSTGRCVCVYARACAGVCVITSTFREAIFP